MRKDIAGFIATSSMFVPFVAFARTEASPSDGGAVLTPLGIAVLVLVLLVGTHVVLLRVLVEMNRRKSSGAVPPRSDGPFDAVIAVVGLKAAGKDEFCRILGAHDFTTRRISDSIRAEARRRGESDPSVATLVTLGNEGRATGGSGYWAEQLINDFARDGIRLAVVNGIRNPGELDALRKASGEALIVVGITAPFALRMERFLKRKQAGDVLTKDGFREMDEVDRGKGEPADGQQVDLCMGQVWPDNLYENSGTLEEYQAWTKEFLSRHGLLRE